MNLMEKKQIIFLITITKQLSHNQITFNQITLSHQLIKAIKIIKAILTNKVNYINLGG